MARDPFRAKRLTADALADALAATLTDTGMHRHAADLGRRVRAEDGVGRTVSCFDAMAAR